MNKKIIIIIGILLLIIIIPVYGYFDNNKDIKNHKDVIELNNNIKDIEDFNMVLKEYNEYKEYFSDDKEVDFNNNNYAVVKLSYDSCADEDIYLTDYKINKDKIDVYFTYNRSCGVCQTQIRYYLIKIDKSINNIQIVNHYNVNKTEYCDPNVSYKPMIYIYPEYDMNVTIKLGKQELLTTTYPKYVNEWNVFAKTNGDLIINDRLYYGLYWEGINNINDIFEDGFVVNKKNLIPFLEDKLKILGLNEKESNEFIVYWLPILEKNEYNLIRFEDIDIINEEMPLDINPKPDNIIRVLMAYKPIDKDYKIKEQELISNKRNGFTVVEWGGTLIK